MRKITIASWALAIGLTCPVAVPTAASAGTLLSGYGGPGAGEQAIVGATLLGSGGSRGSGTSGGSGNGATQGESLAQGASVAQSGIGGPAERSQGATRGRPGQGAADGAATHGSSNASTGGRGGSSNTTFAYPSALRSKPSSGPLGISGTDWLTALAAGVVLVAVGGATLRLARLQR